MGELIIHPAGSSLGEREDGETAEMSGLVVLLPCRAVAVVCVLRAQLHRAD